MSKISVMAVNSDFDGVGLWRILMPHICMNDPELKVDVRLLTDSTLPILEERFLSQYNIIFYNKVIPFSDQNKEDYFFDLCKKLNIKIIYDIDDYWVLDNSHLNYKNWKENKSQEKIESVIRRADVVTTTTPIFAERLRQVNKNVFVLENAINKNENQWLSNKVPSDKVRFIWGGGISHQVDLRMLKDSFKKFDKDFLKKSQFYMCGYDLRIKHADGQIGKDDPLYSQWTFFESIFTNDWKYIDTIDYREFLNSHDKTDFGYNEKFKDEWFNRRWTKSILEFGNMYQESDISLAPMKDNHSFNRYKSQLKLIEAGANHNPIIMSKTAPYLIDDIEKNGLGFYVEESKGNWYEKMKYYVDNPSLIKEQGEANYQYFLEHFEMQVVNKKRADFYKYVASQDAGNVKI